MGNKGKTSGSRVIFVKDDMAYTVHKPHSGNVVKMYVMKQVNEYLKELGLI